MELEIKPIKEKKKILPLVMALGNSIIKKLGIVEAINSQVEWDQKKWSLSPGALAKTVILSTFFDMRTPLIHIQERFEHIDLSYLLGEEAEISQNNSFNIGRALERLGGTDCDGLYERLALTAVQMNDIPVKRLHADTTTISFYGEYDVDSMDLTDEEKEELLNIERGYNKDGRPQCNQIVVGQIVNEAGIPLVSKPMDGSPSDVEWNKEAVKYLDRIVSEGFETGIFVADSKHVIEELVTTMMNPGKRIRFVSRCPASFENKLESRMIEKAYETEKWEDIGKFHEGKNASFYQGISFTETVCGYPMRLLVLHSSALADKVEPAIEKEKEALKPLIKGMVKKKFACLADAEQEIERSKALKKTSLFDCLIEIEQETKEVWPKGRRSARTQPKVVETYHIQVKEINRNEEACRKFSHIESCIVLISNVLEEESNQDLMKIYKGQQVVENSFRLLKQPNLASVIYLNHPVRIKALSMLLTISLLIRALIQYKMREGLKTFKEDHPGVKLYVGWNDRELIAPTYKLFFEHAIHCCFEKEGKDQYSFAYPNGETQRRVSTLLDLMGVTLNEILQ